MSSPKIEATKPPLLPTKKSSLKTAKRHRTVFMTVFLLPTFIFYCIFTVYPLLRGLYVSFFDWSGSAESMKFIGLDNYKEMANDPIILIGLLNDYFLVIGKVIGIVVLATLFAVAVTRMRVQGASFFRVIFFIPNIISVAVIAVLWRAVYHPSLGFLNSFLSLFTLEPVSTVWLGNSHSIWAILVPSIWAGIGFYMVLLIAAILSIPSEMYEASEIDGATGAKQFFRITLPLIWEQVKTSILHITITTLNGSLVIVWIMTEGGPDNATQVMGSYLYQMGFRQSHMGYAAAIGVLILLASLVTTAILSRLLRREVHEM
ncbi:sugar ABC transporter permease [Paenibacillus sp. N1-5-1-14]|uniref:carbohydrate ABC transporter permease n=1 Tax=Paenibacillus radicibacter TaxID=2972488 RepID=UPI002158ACD4|nr:sugar ABC transporter permease [Paenibacillus radicibacter]MCR8643700.1 sugar ABC transporter permease [Paenibacillus radicibacter]